MSPQGLNLVILCVCGQPEEAHGYGKSKHSYIPDRGVPPLRDDQRPKKAPRHGHYALKEYRNITQKAPLPGVDIKATVPGAARWRVQCLQAQLTTSAVVANRVPHLVITDGQGNSLYNFPSSSNQLAGSTVQYSAGTTVVSLSFDSATVMVLPFPVKLLQGWTIGFVTTALDAGDQWSNLALHVKEWLNF